MAYKNTEISPWLQPPAHDRKVPPLRLVIQYTGDANRNTPSAIQLDFGVEGGGLFITGSNTL
jgi:cephalosporin-C deacetylase-like acetyl esterase